MKVKKRWYRCPKCNQKLLKYDDTKGKSKKIYIKCKSCKREIEIIID